MKPEATNWHDVALAKLTKVMGQRVGHELALSVLTELGIERISSAADLRRVADALTERGGFAAAVGGLLGVHVAMYDQEAPRG